jgi:hypothetical protein
VTAAPLPGAPEGDATAENGLASLFERERRRVARQATLASALLGDGGARYLFRRAVGPLARLPLRTALHAAEVVVLADFVELGVLGWLLAIRSATVLFGSFHWGALEPFRRAMRRHAALGKKGDAEAELARYLRLSFDLCLVLLVALVAFTELGPRPFPTFSIFDAYAIGCAVRAMGEAVTRTYHAGAFALRRIRRPLGSFLVLDLVDAGTPLALWPWLGPWGFAVGQLAGTIVETALTTHYARRTYAELGLVPPSFRRIVGEKTRVPLSLARGMLAPGAGNLAGQIDAVLVAALVGAAAPELFGLAALVHVLRPVLSLSSSWARSFYFDLSRLDGPVRVLFRARLERLLLRATPSLALLSAAFALGIGVLLTRAAPVPALAWVLPFLVARAFYSVAQLRAFVRGAYARLMLGGAAVAVAALLLPRLHESPGVVLLTASVALATAAWVSFASKGEGPQFEEDDALPLLRPLPFLARVARLPREHELTLVGLNELEGVHAPAVARALAGLPDVAAAARLDRRLVALAADPGRVPTRAIVEASGGTARSVERWSLGDDGREVLAAVSSHDERPPGAPRAQPSAERVLRDDFARRFPGGTVLDARSGRVPGATASPRTLTFTLAELGALASGVRPSRRRGLRACVYAPRAQATLVFVAPPDADAAQFAAFGRDVSRASVDATLAQ